MACLKMLLSGSLTFVITTTLVTANLLPKYYPSRYDIKLKTYINNNNFYGESNITMFFREPTQEISLYAERLCIIDIILIQSLEGFNKDDKKIKIIESNYTYDKDTHIIDLYSMEVFPKECIINVRFAGALHDNRGIRTFYRRRRNVAYEKWLPAICFLKADTQTIFSCWDDVRLASKFNISIMHHKNYEILSNMPKHEEEANEKGMLWTHFDTTPEMYIYLLAVVMANKSIFCELYKVDYITLWGRPNYLSDLWYAQSVMENVTKFIHNIKWKSLREIQKIDNIAIPNYQDYDMPNAGLIFYRESDILYNKDADPAGHKIEITRLIGYKTSQEWLPHFHMFCSLSPWVQKALATFMGTFIVDKVFPETRIMNLFVVQVQHEVLFWDGYFESQTPFYEAISYLKGYYRVNYDPENWRLISNYLKSENYLNIHVLNRAQIIDDAFHLVLGYKLRTFRFWDIANYLKQETDYVAWYPMLKALEFMSRIFGMDVSGRELAVKIIASIKQEQENDYAMQFYKEIQIKIKLRSHQIESQTQYLNTLVI
ncbi:hypothetical protein ACFW04_008327 [Cataglyphis niger]